VARFQVGPRANAVGCTRNPTKLAGAAHCQPVVNIGGSDWFGTVGNDNVLRRLMNLRHHAQSKGIQIEGVQVPGKKIIRITQVIGPRLPSKAEIKEAGRVAAAQQTRKAAPTPALRRLTAKIIDLDGGGRGILIS